MVAMFALTQTPLGRMANAVRDNSERAEFVGYDPRTVRFCRSSCPASSPASPAALYAINYEIVTADTVARDASPAPCC